MRTRQMLLDGRTRLIASVILDHGPICAGAIRSNLIERHGSNQYTDMTPIEVAQHVRRHLGNIVTVTGPRKCRLFALRGDGGEFDET